jgi:hypothetical protein
MSRRNSRARRKNRKERLEALRQAKADFNTKFPERGTTPTALMLNMIALKYGREEASARLSEATDPLKFDNILMKKKAELRKEFFRNDKWREGVESLDHSGWAKPQIN